MRRPGTVRVRKPPSSETEAASVAAVKISGLSPLCDSADTQITASSIHPPTETLHCLSTSNRATAKATTTLALVSTATKRSSRR
ncbi:hypothetical protein D9M69_575500 [compost metagenome]